MTPDLSKSAPENPNAFPLNAGEHGYEPDFGMTLRDWFAGQLAPITFNESYGNDWGKSGTGHAPRAAQRAYEWADAMLAERAKGGAL